MTRTSIEWVRNPGDGSQGFTVNPIRSQNKETGKVGHYCEKLSPGCKNCYASRMQKGPYLSGLEFIAENKDRGELFFDENVLHQVLRRRKPSTFFWADCTDMFGDWVTDDWINRCAATCALTPWHRHLWLTKRAKRMREYLNQGPFNGYAGGRTTPILETAKALALKNNYDGYAALGRFADGPLPNLGLGVSAEDQERADERIPDLLATPAAMRFVSVEPMLGAVNLGLLGTLPKDISPQYRATYDLLHWVIVGGESGPGARPMHPDWVRSVRDQCQASGVPFFFKQWGEHAPEPFAQLTIQAGQFKPPQGMVRVGKKAAGRILDGRTWDEMPEMLK